MTPTVPGPVAPKLLGQTLKHEHMLCDLTPPKLAAECLPPVEIRAPGFVVNPDGLYTRHDVFNTLGIPG